MREIKTRKYNDKPNQTSFKKGHPGMKSENNPMWKGDGAGYGAIHDWLKLHFGEPKFCEHCGSQTAKKYEWANISKKYKRDRTDWLRLCTSCHHKYDESRKKMRDIRFRAWDRNYEPACISKDGKAHPAMEYFGLGCSAYTLNCDIQVDGGDPNVTIMQYTGLKDKNGKESYWDDIAKDKYGQVFLIVPDYDFLAHLQTIEFEVIGNIHESPHLLDNSS